MVIEGPKCRTKKTPWHITLYCVKDATAAKAEYNSWFKTGKVVLDYYLNTEQGDASTVTGCGVGPATYWKSCSRPLFPAGKPAVPVIPGNMAQYNCWEKYDTGSQACFQWNKL